MKKKAKGKMPKAQQTPYEKVVEVMEQNRKESAPVTEKRYDARGWIGVDLDGTLAYHLPLQTMDVIGEPIPAMMARVKQWVLEGKRVKIFTARAAYDFLIPPVEEWLAKHGLPGLEVTNQKDFSMIQLWDDCCVQVESNTGRLLGVE